MSHATIAAIGQAVAAHLADIDAAGAILGDWVVCYSSMRPDATAGDDEDGILHGVGYVVSPMSTPHASIGILVRGTSFLEAALDEDAE